MARHERRRLGERFHDASPHELITLLSARAGFVFFDFARPWWAVGLERVEELERGVTNFLYGAIESLAIDLRRFRHSAQLAHVL